MVERTFRIQNSSGDDFAGDIRYVDEGVRRPLLVVCHGFTAHKDWGPFPYFGRRFAELGFASVVFNFSHNGIGDNHRKFTELDKFSRNTIGKELEDLRAVIDAVEQGEIGRKIVDAERIGLVGHSRGGGVAILFASLDHRIKAVAGWSTVSTFFRYTSHQKELWEKQGFMPVTIRSMKTKLRYGIEVLRDLEANKEQYDLVATVKGLTVPLLLVHGEADVTVRPTEAQKLFEASDKSKTELILVEHTGHMYGTKSGSGIPNPTLEYITDITAKWFHRHL
ncbi:MAG: Alpha/beta hydrolase family protein [Bacteroidetes bacterium]|nr:Alpha/beta hydrolase family protein [Bacteroidota bacterium]